jgi:signal transduction histidine kinase
MTGAVNAMAYSGDGPVNGILDGRSWAPLRLVRDPLTWRAAAYLLVSMGFGLAWFVILVTGISLSAGLLVIWVGVPLFALLMIAWRGGAMLERFLVRAAFGVTIPSPYRRLPAGGPFRKWRAMAFDPATWKDLAYLAVLFPITLIEFVISVAMWAATGMFLFLPLIVMIDGSRVFIDFGDNLTFVITQPVAALPASVVGLVLMVISLYVTRTVAVAHASFARLLLGPSENQRLRAQAEQLQARTAQLQASRARGVDAAEAERRRIERDLHDGAQQRLLAVAMDIGRAKIKLDSDLEGARALIEQAHAGTREAISELRDLARGIYPAILTDRGLDSALSALAGRAPVPVVVEVQLPTRPPAAVESIAYFIVAESLANIAKYARATRAGVRVTREDQWVVIEISDNGVGGAVATPGGGLAGLADRAAGIDGILTVNSPVGGPTVIRADLPCVW